mgnify:CR=1 FL=1
MGNFLAVSRQTSAWDQSNAFFPISPLPTPYSCPPTPHSCPLTHPADTDIPLPANVKKTLQ